MCVCVCVCVLVRGVLMLGYRVLKSCILSLMLLCYCIIGADTTFEVLKSGFVERSNVQVTFQAVHL